MERAAEERVRKAKEDAQVLVKEAREKAESIVRAIESDPTWEESRRARSDEIGRYKREIEEKYKQDAAALGKLASENFEKAVARLVQETLRGKL